MTSPRRGEVWLVDLGMAANVRLALVISVPAEDVDRALVTLVPHTTSPRQSRFEATAPEPRGAGRSGARADCEHRDPRMPPSLRRRARSGSPTIARRPSPTLSCIARPSQPQPRRAAGPCIGTTASACFATRRRRSAADVDAFVYAMGRSIGPPWQAKHKLAAAAALAATGRPAPGPTAG